MRPLIALVYAAICSAVLTSFSLAAPAHADNRVTPEDVTEYGFDQCVAPTQSAMEPWVRNSPFSAHATYLSAASRSSHTQPTVTRHVVHKRITTRPTQQPHT